MFRLSLKDKTALPYFAGLCFFLSLIDVLVPKPVPFFRLGLANIALMLSLDVLSSGAFFLLLLLKVLGQAMLSGTMFSYIIIFSFVGTFSSGTLMYLLNFLRRKNVISFLGISMLGALASNTAQFFIARFAIFGEGAYLILPLLFLISMFSSFVIGIFANSFYRSSLWYESFLTGELELKEYETNLYNINKTPAGAHRLIIGLLMIFFLVFLGLPQIKLVVFAVALVLCVLDKIRMHIVSTILTSLCIILVNLFPPFGFVIFEVHLFDMIPIILTKEALLQGIEKVILFEGLLYTSKWMLKSELKLGGTFGNLLQKSLFVFQRLMTCKKEIKITNLVGSVDSVLLSLNRLI